MGNADFAGLSLFSGLGLSGLTVAFFIFLALLFSSYVRIATVLGIVRAGFGVMGLPTAFVTGGLALCLSFFVMYPTLRGAGSALDSVAAEKGAALTDKDRVLAITKALGVWKEFLVAHTTPAERERFARLAVEMEGQPPGQTDPAPQLDQRMTTWQILAPAFVTSEMRLAFQTGLRLLLPFIVIDLLTAMVMAMLGVDTLNAALVALPFKLLLFVMVDGWSLITTNLVSGYIA